MTKVNFSDLADALLTTSKIASQLGIDISAKGLWRKVLIANALKHELKKDNEDLLLDAIKDDIKYCYLSSHYGKRPQLYLSSLDSLSLKTKKENNHTFIITFFSPEDSSKILRIWSCSSEIVWEECHKQIERRVTKSKSKNKQKSLVVHFSEAWLKSKKDNGAKLIFKSKVL